MLRVQIKLSIYLLNYAKCKKKERKSTVFTNINSLTLIVKLLYCI